jgi:hypothetical protein
MAWYETHAEAQRKRSVEKTNRTSQVVPRHSAILSHEKYETISSIDANHSEICKFSDDTDEGYKAIVGVLQDYLDKAVNQST